MKATATEVKNHFGEFLEKAQRGPIMVEKSGRMVAVLLSREDYDRLQALEDHYWGERALAAQKSGYIGPEETLHILTERLRQIEEEENSQRGAKGQENQDKENKKNKDKENKEAEGRA